MQRKAARLREAGLKATAPRIQILAALEIDKSHPTAEELHDRLRGEHPSLSLSTVYKTLEVFLRAACAGASTARARCALTARRSSTTTPCAVPAGRSTTSTESTPGSRRSPTGCPKGCRSRVSASNTTSSARDAGDELGRGVAARGHPPQGGLVK